MMQSVRHALSQTARLGRPRLMSTQPPKQSLSYIDLAHRTAVTGLLGLGVYGLWYTAAVWKSRRGGDIIVTSNGEQIHVSREALQLSQQDPYPITNDPAHEPGRNV